MGVSYGIYCEKHKEWTNLQKYQPSYLWSDDNSIERWEDECYNGIGRMYDTYGKMENKYILKMAMFMARHNGCKIKYFNDAADDQPKDLGKYTEIFSKTNGDAISRVYEKERRKRNFYMIKRNILSKFSSVIIYVASIAFVLLVINIVIWALSYFRK